MNAPHPAGTPDVRVVGVRYLNEYVARVVAQRPALRSLGVRGEITNLRRQPNGNAYFDLKEGDYVLRCVAWARDARLLPPLDDGTRIVAYGEVLVFERRGQVQLVVKSAVVDGVGDVHAQFLALKRKLEAEGLFDPARKRALPRYPFRVALVSSRRADGAVDFATILAKRSPHVHLEWCETAVQGPNARFEIADAIDYASSRDVDTIVLSRGGGSFEDLFSFSAEPVVRAIVRARHPVMSAVGHTADQQLSDFAADARASTPSEAAAIVSPETRELVLLVARNAGDAERTVRKLVSAELRHLERTAAHPALAQPQRRLERRARRAQDALRTTLERVRFGMERRRDRIVDLERALGRRDPAQRLAQRRERLTAARATLAVRGRDLVRRRTASIVRAEAAALPALRRALERKRRELSAKATLSEPAVRRALARHRGKLALVRARLDPRDPQAVLERGYAIVTLDGLAVRDAAAVPLGSKVKALVARGTLTARVETAEADGDQSIG